MYFEEIGVDEEKLLQELFDRYDIAKHHRRFIESRLDSLGRWHYPTKLHSIRVSDYAARIGEHCEIPGIEPKPLFWAGSLHDIGKERVRLELLERKDFFSAADYEEIKAHVEHTYWILKDMHHMTAHIDIGHHLHGRDPYPKQLPQLPDYLIPKKGLIDIYRRLLALADYYDTLLTRNDRLKFGKTLSPQEKREQFLRDNVDQLELVLKLEEKKVLTFQA